MSWPDHTTLCTRAPLPGQKRHQPFEAPTPALAIDLGAAADSALGAQPLAAARHFLLKL
jgi:hypothetical protein